MRLFLAILLVLVLSVLLPARPLAKLTPKEVQARLSAFWLEYDARYPTEKQITSNGGIEWRLFKENQAGDPPNQAYMIDHENESVGWLGQLTLNAEVEPMWLDFKYREGPREYVWLGIIRFEGEHLRWVRTGNVDARKWAEARGNLPERPKAFEDEKKQPLGYRLERARNQK